MTLGGREGERSKVCGVIKIYQKMPYPEKKYEPSHIYMKICIVFKNGVF